MNRANHHTAHRIAGPSPGYSRVRAGYRYDIAMHKLTGSLLCGLLLVLACLGSASSDANTPPPGQLVASFVYNPSGLRIEKQGERGVERFTYDEQSLLQAYDENNTTLAKYDYGAERLVSLTSSSEPVQFYLTDALNSVVNLTNTAGSVQARYQYDAFGNQRAQSGSSYNRFAFTGYVEDKETDLLYAKARYYDSDTGRFLSQDAWEGQNDLPPSLHKYLYAYQNPTVWVDPTGNIQELVQTAEYLKKKREESAQAASEQDTAAGKMAGVTAGVGQAVIGTGELAVRSVNFVANSVVSQASPGSALGRESSAELDGSFSALEDTGKAIKQKGEVIAENPSGFAMKTGDAIAEFSVKVKTGDATALNQLGEITGGLFIGAKGAGSAATGVQQTAKVVTQAGRSAEKIFKNSNNISIQQIRRNYVKEIYSLEHGMNAMKEVGHSWDYIAERMNTMRIEIGIKYKNMTPPIQRLAIYARNITPKEWTFTERLFGGLKPKGYDSIYGPSTGWLRANGLSSEEIARKAVDPNRQLTRQLGIEPNDIRRELGLPRIED